MVFAIRSAGYLALDARWGSRIDSHCRLPASLPRHQGQHVAGHRRLFARSQRKSQYL